MLISSHCLGLVKHQCQTTWRCLQVACKTTNLPINLISRSEVAADFFSNLYSIFLSDPYSSTIADSDPRPYRSVQACISTHQDDLAIAKIKQCLGHHRSWDWKHGTSAFGPSCSFTHHEAHKVCGSLTETQELMDRFTIEIMDPLCNAIQVQLPGEADLINPGTQQLTPELRASFVFELFDRFHRDISDMSRVCRALSTFCEAHQPNHEDQCKAWLPETGLCTAVPSTENEYCDDHQYQRNFRQFWQPSGVPKDIQPRGTTLTIQCSKICISGDRFCDQHDAVALEERFSDVRDYYSGLMEDWGYKKLANQMQFFVGFDQESKLYQAHRDLPVGQMVWILNQIRLQNSDEDDSPKKTPFCNGRSERLFPPDKKDYDGGAENPKWGHDNEQFGKEGRQQASLTSPDSIPDTNAMKVRGVSE